MNGTGGNKNMDAMAVRAFHRCMDFLDVIRIAACEAADNRAKIRHPRSLLLIRSPGRCCREAGLNDVDVELRERLGNTQLFP